MENTKTLVGERIRALRKEKGWSQEELGEKASLHHTYVGAVERGEKNASIETLGRIAEALKTYLVDLFPTPQVPINTDKLRSLVLEEIKKCPSDILKVIADLLAAAQSTESSVQRKRKRAQTPKNRKA